MPNGWSRPEANTSLLLGLAAPSAARRTRIRPGSDAATKMSPFGATRTVRGSRRSEANSSTWKPGGTFGAAETGFAITRGGFDTDRVVYGGGRSVILRRTNGASVRQSPNAALPTNNCPQESEAGCAKTAGAKGSTQVASAAIMAAAKLERGMLGDQYPKAPLRSGAAVICI